MRTRLLLVFAVWLAVCRSACAQGGPPLRTDDPGTPGNENWEINFGFISELRSGEQRFELPNLDLNYGVGDRLQLKWELPWVVLRGDTARDGLGNSLVGVKWRFYDNEKRALAISIYPQLQFNNPNHSARRGLAEPGTAFLFPVEVTKQVGPVSLNVEAGHWFSRDHPRWIAGFAAGHQLTPRVELLAETYHVSARRPEERDTSFDAGGRLKLAGPVLLIFAAGRGFGAQPHFLGYFGLQFLVHDDWEPEDHPGETRRP